MVSDSWLAPDWYNKDSSRIFLAVATDTLIEVPFAHFPTFLYPKHVSTKPHLPLHTSAYSWSPFLFPNGPVSRFSLPLYPGWYTWVWVTLPLYNTNSRNSIALLLYVWAQYSMLFLDGDKGHNPKLHTQTNSRNQAVMFFKVLELSIFVACKFSK